MRRSQLTVIVCLHFTLTINCNYYLLVCQDHCHIILLIQLVETSIVFYWLAANVVSIASLRFRLPLYNALPVMTPTTPTVSSGNRF